MTACVVGWCEWNSSTRVWIPGVQGNTLAMRWIYCCNIEGKHIQTAKLQISTLFALERLLSMREVLTRHLTELMAIIYSTPGASLPVSSGEELVFEFGVFTVNYECNLKDVMLT